MLGELWEALGNFCEPWEVQGIFGEFWRILAKFGELNLNPKLSTG